MNEDVAQGVVAAPVVKLQGLPAYLERVGVLEGDVGRLAPRVAEPVEPFLCLSVPYPGPV